jgi:hypothetical protein
MRRYQQSQVAFPSNDYQGFYPSVQFAAIAINTVIAKQSIRAPQVFSAFEVRRLLVAITM